MEEIDEEYLEEVSIDLEEDIEEQEVEEIVEETDIPKSRPQFEKNIKYEKPEVEDRIVDLRNEGKSWEDITEVMRVELEEPKMSKGLTQKVYNRAIARTITTEKRAGKKFKDHTNELDRMYGRIVKTLEKYSNAAEKIADGLEEEVNKNNIDAIKAYAFMLKSAPQMKAISSEIREFIKLQLDMQDKIRIEQAGLIYDDTRILDEIEKAINRLEKEGKIRWIKQKTM
jgi:hypothetical protein